MLSIRYRPTSWADAAPVEVPRETLRAQWTAGHRKWLFLGPHGKSTWLYLLSREFLAAGQSVRYLDGLKPDEWDEELQAPWPYAFVIDNLHLASPAHQALLNWIPATQIVLATAHSMQLLRISRFTASALQFAIPVPASWQTYLVSIIQREPSLAHLCNDVVTADTTIEHLEWASLFQISLTEARMRWQHAYRAKQAWTEQWQTFMRESIIRDDHLFRLWQQVVDLHNEQGVSAYDLIRWARQCGQQLVPVTQRVLRFERLVAKQNLGPNVTLLTLACMLYQLSSKSAM